MTAKPSTSRSTNDKPVFTVFLLFLSDYNRFRYDPFDDFGNDAPITASQAAPDTIRQVNRQAVFLAQLGYRSKALFEGRILGVLLVSPISILAIDSDHIEVGVYLRDAESAEVRDARDIVAIMARIFAADLCRKPCAHDVFAIDLVAYDSVVDVEQIPLDNIHKNLGKGTHDFSRGRNCPFSSFL
jgi:hypothetical protein